MRFSLPFKLPPLALYRALRRLNPSPFLFFLDFGDFAVVGSSPEILVRLRDGTVTIRPLAGTRRRGANAEEDGRLAEELLADPKELAEHLMLLDLARNDVGPAVKMGSGRARPALRGDGRAGRRLPRRHPLGRAQGARHGNHRRARARAAQLLWRHD